MQEGDRMLAVLAQQLENEAAFLVGNGEHRARPTLTAQREKIQEVEKAAIQRAGNVMSVLPGDPMHKRATEQAREAIVTRGVVEVNPVQHPRTLHPEGNFDQELHRKHAERLTNWAEAAKESTVARCQRLYWKQLVKDFRTNANGLLDNAGLRRAVIGQPGGGAGSAGSGASLMPRDRDVVNGENGKLILIPGESTPAGSTLQLDYRAPQYSIVVQHLSAPDAIQQLKQLSALGPKGERAPHLKTSLHELWDTVARMLKVHGKVHDAGLPKQLSRIGACRQLLEEDFLRFLGRECRAAGGGPGPAAHAFNGADTVKTAVKYAQMQHVSGGEESELCLWAAAFWCLRSGDNASVAKLCRSLGDNFASTAAEHNWPSIVTTPSGALAVNPAIGTKGQLEPITDEQLAENPYKCAVRLILGRAATVQDAERVRKALIATPALRFAQDHVWYHLALVNCVVPPADASLTTSAEGGDAPYCLQYYQKLVQNVPPSELSVLLDPLLYTKVMLWSGCLTNAVSSLLPPTVLEDLHEYTLEGLHLALVLTREGVFKESARDQNEPSVESFSVIELQIQTQLQDYVLRLIPHDAMSGLYYLSRLPEGTMQKAFFSVCLNKDVCAKLLGSVTNDGNVHVEDTAAAAFWPSSHCAWLATGAAGVARERGTVLQATQLYIIAVHHLLSASKVGGAEGAAALPAHETKLGYMSAVVRALLSFLNPRLSHAIEDMDDTSTPLTEATQDVLAAARVVFAHLQTLSCDTQSEALALRAFEQLYWMAVLCWNVSGGNVARAWQAYSSLGILPRESSDVARLVEEVNYRCDAATVRKVLHVAVVKVLDLIYHGLSTSAPEATADRSRLIEMARAVSTFQSQLRVSPNAGTSARLVNRRRLLHSLGV
ncbi:hypothetical protein DIPPA_12845 [Diplonema papillatum]|nr:hypothetical protein DIPPA_12845 [Diplonema papillatum]